MNHLFMMYHFLPVRSVFDAVPFLMLYFIPARNHWGYAHDALKIPAEGKLIGITTQGCYLRKGILPAFQKFCRLLNPPLLNILQIGNAKSLLAQKGQIFAAYLKIFCNTL